MNFTCTKNLLADALGQVGRAVATRSDNLVALTGVRLQVASGRLALAATDLDLTIEHSIAVSASTDGTAVIPARLLSDMVRSLPEGNLTLSVEETASSSDATIKAGRTSFQLRTLEAAGFPALRPAPTGAATIDAAQLAAALRQVVPAAAPRSGRMALTGILMASEGTALRLVGTDSYRLAIRDLPATSVVEEGRSVLIPATALSEVARMAASGGQITIRLGDNRAVFESGTLRITTTLIEEEFPNYRGLIPAALPNRLTAQKASLLASIKRARLCAGSEGPKVRLSLSDTANEISAVTDTGTASEEIEAKYEGEAMVIGLNPDFLAAAVEAVEGDEVAIEADTALRPVLVRAASGDTTYSGVVMPVRLS